MVSVKLLSILSFATMALTAPTEAPRQVSIELANVQAYGEKNCAGDVIDTVPIDGPAGQCDFLFPVTTAWSIEVTSVSGESCFVEVFTDTNCISINGEGRFPAPVGVCVTGPFPIRSGRVVCPS